MYWRGIPATIDAVVFAEVVRLLDDWAVAETAGDLELLDRLLDTDFRGDDARGLVLTKTQWLDRHRSRAATARFEWQLTHLDVRNGVAIARGAHSPSRNGDVIATVVAVQRSASWRVVNVQLNGRGRAGPSTERQSS
jgi:hypothetical protein